MKKYYSLEPEVAGELGTKTEIDNSTHPPLVSKLHFKFSGWLGNEILECFPCYIVTEFMMKKIYTLQPTGCKFENLFIERSKQFKELYSDKELPKFKWLKINGQAGKDDFGLSPNNLLVVSERILKLLKNHRLNECDIEEWK